MLERALIEPKVQPTENKKPEAAPAAPSPASEPTPTVDVSFDTLVAFTSKVQPILMNKCAICHANGEGGSFHLDRVSDAGSKATTQRNLAAVLRQIDLEHPAISPLLVKAITRHGDAKAPAIRDRSDKPMVAMQQWVELAVARNPQLKDYARKQSPTKTIPEPKGVFPSQRSSKSPEGSSVISQSAPRLEIDAKNPPRVQPVEVKEMPIATTTPADEFDALHFNRWAHPALYQQQTVNARSQ
jgi:hypothetical protein